MANGTSEAIKNHAAFIWSVADLLRGDYKQSEYGRVVLPLTVLRRFDCVLAPVKADMLVRYEQLQGKVENAVVFDQVDADLVADEEIQMQAGANELERFMAGLDAQWQSQLINRMKLNEELVLTTLDNPELQAAWLERSGPKIYAQAKVARQRTCPIGELIQPDGETSFVEYKSTLRWDVNRGEKSKVMEDAVVKTIAGFANSKYGGTLLAGVTDEGGIYGLESDYATFSKRGERGDRDLWGQHLKNLLDRLGKPAATLVDWEFFTIEGEDICRVSIDPSDHPVYETKGDETVFWWRTPVSTDAVKDENERDRVIARRWGS